jgi:hypothetical protein
MCMPRLVHALPGFSAARLRVGLAPALVGGLRFIDRVRGHWLGRREALPDRPVLETGPPSTLFRLTEGCGNRPSGPWASTGEWHEIDSAVAHHGRAVVRTRISSNIWPGAAAASTRLPWRPLAASEASDNRMALAAGLSRAMVGSKVG